MSFLDVEPVVLAVLAPATIILTHFHAFNKESYVYHTVHLLKKITKTSHYRVLEPRNESNVVRYIRPPGADDDNDFTNVAIIMDYDYIIYHGQGYN